jgi:hypothetical protein
MATAQNFGAEATLVSFSSKTWSLHEDSEVHNKPSIAKWQKMENKHGYHDVINIIKYLLHTLRETNRPMLTSYDSSNKNR